MADTTSSNDFDPKDFTRTVNQHDTDLITLKEDIEELKGKKLDEKICKAIEDSTHIQDKISSLVWKTIREKLVWIILVLLGLLLWDILKDLISSWLPRP